MFKMIVYIPPDRLEPYAVIILHFQAKVPSNQEHLRPLLLFPLASPSFYVILLQYKKIHVCVQNLYYTYICVRIIFCTNIS